MSVSETSSLEHSPRSAQQDLAITSVIGGVLLLAGVWFILGGLPSAWDATWDSMFANNNDLRRNMFLSGALLVLVDLLAIGMLVYLAFLGLQRPMPHGARAGMFFFAAVLFLAMWIGVLLGGPLEDQFSDNHGLGMAIVGLIVLAIIGGAIYVYMKVPAWMGLLETVENQGWFYGGGYKGNQGVRVRRGTIMGILAVGIMGIVVMVQRRSFGTVRPDTTNDWEWILPFTERARYIPLMYSLHIVLPIILGLLLVWIAYRIVNIPTFGDFLIATEAEMNKVSWTNRRRLVQDTIVVLVTVVLFTGFLFGVDIIWIRILSMPGVRVLAVDLRAEAEKQQQKAEW